MGVRETLDKIENMVATAKTFPFTGHILINDNDLVHYVEELRHDLPQELDKAEKIVKTHDQIIKDAQREAEQIRVDAERQAAAMVENSEIVLKSKQRGKEILQETQQKETAMIKAAEAQARELQNNVDTYANQVFDQMIAHVSRTFEGVQQAQNGVQQAAMGVQQVTQGLQQALQVLQTAKAGLNQPQPPVPAEPEAETAKAEEAKPTEQ